MQIKDDKYSFQSNPLLGVIAQRLHENPAGLSEYELMQVLDFEGLHLDDEPGVTADLLLFRKHFLIMNALYRLQPILLDEGFDLEISALHIQLHALPDQQDFSGTRQLSADNTAGAVRDYYLDWQTFRDSSSDYVESLLNSFWQRFAGEGGREAAYATLELEPEQSRETIRSQFRRLASCHHPDRGGDTETFQKIRAAYELLMS